MADPFGWAVMRRMLSDEDRPSAGSVDWTELVLVALVLALVGAGLIAWSPVVLVVAGGVACAWVLYRPAVFR